MRTHTRSFGNARSRWAFALVVLSCLIYAPAALAAPVLTPVVGSPFATGSASDPISVAFSPSGALLAAANDSENTVSMFSVSASGALSAVAGSPFATGNVPTSAAFSPNGQLLAVTNIGDGTVSVFSVSAAGALAPAPGSPFATGNTPLSVAFNPSGALLATGNVDDGTVSVFSVAATGALTPVAGAPFVTGHSPTSVAFSAGGLLATANLADNTVSVFSVAASGALSPVAGSPVATGAGPFTVAFNSTGGLLATANNAGGSVSVFSVSAAGALAPTAGSPFATGVAPGSVAFRPGGGLLVAGDSTNGTVGVYLLSATGVLTPAEGSPVTTGSTLFPVAFNPAGTLVATSSHNAVTGAGSVSMFSVALPTDTTPPVIVCPSASTQWLAANASIRCTATDTGGSGLAIPAQASITLTTNVPAGSETANAITNSVRVCDIAGNCATAGPIAGNKIDRKAPAITLTRPANGATYSRLGTVLNPVKVSYSCADGGSGIAACTGTQPNGATLNIGLLSLGTHTFTVTARDVAGNTSSVTNSYRVGLL
jgi:6-phosphogluconolactonase